MGNIFIGDSSSKARKINNVYIGIDGKARKVKQAYIGDSNGKARLVWSSQSSMCGNIACLYGNYLYLSNDNFVTYEKYTNGYEIMNCICFCKDAFYIGTSYGKVFSFKDGTFINLYNSSAQKDIFGVCVHDNNIVFYSYSKTIVSKDGGKTWTEQEMGVDYNFDYGNDKCMIHNGTEFVCIKPSGYIYTSPTGEVWTKKALAVTKYKYLFYVNGRYYVASDGVASFYYSTDLINWTACRNYVGESWIPSGESSTRNTIPRISYINGVYTLSQTNQISIPTAYSTDGIYWNTVSSNYPIGGLAFNSFNCGDRIIMFGNSSSTGYYDRSVWITTDGIHYSRITNVEFNANSIAYANE